MNYDELKELLKMPKVKVVQKHNKLVNELFDLQKDMQKMIEILKTTEYQKIDIDYVIETFDIYCNRLKEIK